MTSNSFCLIASYFTVNENETDTVRARSQIPVYGLTGRALGHRSAAPSAGKILE